MPKQKLVLIGNGMAGIRCLEEILKIDPDRFDVTVFGSEPYPNYNRIQLSKVLQGDTSIEDITLNSWSWYEENHIRLYPGETVLKIDKEKHLVKTDKERVAPYDKLIIATGSNPLVLPLPGVKKKGVITFRNISDCQKIIDYSKKTKRAVVIGGGLLGLESARGLLNLGLDVKVVHISAHLMNRQLDATAAHLLQLQLEKQGMAFLLNKRTVAITGDEYADGLKFDDGEEVKADFVVMAVGIRANKKLAEQSGIPTHRGIIVNDYMETDVPDIYAVGECAEHREKTYGLVAPLYQQGKVLAKHICGEQSEGYTGSIVSAKLKVSGVDVFSAGQITEKETTKTIKAYDGWSMTYRNILVEDGKIRGAILFGDTHEGNHLSGLIGKQASVEEYMRAEQAAESETDLVAAMPDDEIVCGCNGVTKETIVQAIKEKGLTTVAQVRACTNASRSCGTCRSLVAELLKHTIGDKFDSSKREEPICSCTTLTRDEVVSAIRDQGLTSVREVMNALDWKNKNGCSKCRPALNYYLNMVNPIRFQDDRESRFVNERMHANIQINGTYSVVPRMYGGVTSSDELRKIADVADKYHVPMIKLTGGQRIDLLGVDKETLPEIWKDLDMRSGFAYAKSVRTVKTCVGKEFCRFGTQDAIGMGIQLEKKFEGLYTPHKVKMGVSACPRSCVETRVKDIGVIGVQGGWEIYVGGNGGTKLRKADLLCKVKESGEVLEYAGAFLQYYRENAKYLERTSAWVERVGIKHVREVLAKKENRDQFNQRMDEALSVIKDPWHEVLHDKKTQEELYRKVKVGADTK
ncbi:NAD(P)/FAD-dependent oxidoreductase [Sporolactobacillus sp. THM7-7]|nr:NAD(P)/FAD-dependent oxidoreductase [Sporolactobacillus sp. THM7-7]